MTNVVTSDPLADHMIQPLPYFEWNEDGCEGVGVEMVAVKRVAPELEPEVAPAPPPSSTPTEGWMIRCTFRLPDDPVYEVHPTTYDAVHALVEGRGASWNEKGNIRTLHFSVEAVDSIEGQRAALPLVDGVLGLFHLNRSAIVNISIASNRSIHQELEALETLPDIVGLHEAAEVLCISKQRIHQLAQTSAFPMPVKKLKSGPVWLKRDITRFNATRRRKPGRPRLA